MTFLAPAVLAGLAALSLPVLIHLLDKLRVREVRWAAMRFLQTAAKKNRRRLRMQDILLLFLRCAVLALVVFAFARPTFQPAGRPGLVAGDALTAMVLLDQSASMGATDGVETRFAAARAAALRFLENLPAGSAAGLLLVHDGYASPVAQPSRDLARVRRRVELAGLTDRGTDFQPALRAAVEALRPLSGRREIHLFTDNQAAGWSQLEASREFLRGAPGIEVVVSAPASADPGIANLALTGLALDTATPVAGQPLRVRAEIANFGTAPADGVRVTVAVDDDAPSADAVVSGLAPGGTRFVPLLVRLPGAGFHTLTAALPPDPAAFDNRRTLALEVAPARDVLVVETRGGPAPWQGTGHFLAAALAPVDEADADRHYLHVVRATAAEIDPARLAGCSVVFLCAAEPLGESAVAALAAYVQGGGGLVVMPGDASPAEAFAAEPWPALLPARIGAPVEPAQDALEPGPFTSALLSLWNDPAAGTLSAVRFSRLFPLEPLTTPAVSTVLRLADGSPVMVEHSVGRGRVVLFAAPPLPAWTNLPLHPAFVPLVHRLYAATARAAATRLNLAPGAVFQASVPIEQLNRDVYVRGPAAGARPVAVGRTELAGTQALLRVRDTALAGRYAVYIGQNEQPDLFFAVQPPAGESDLRSAPGDVLAPPAATAKPGTAAARPPPPSAPPLSAGQLWSLALAAAALLSCTELFCALRASRPR